MDSKVWVVVLVDNPTRRIRAASVGFDPTSRLVYLGEDKVHVAVFPAEYVRAIYLESAEEPRPT